MGTTECVIVVSGGNSELTDRDRVTCFLLITDEDCVEDRCCESQTIPLHLIILNWTSNVNCGVW